MEFCFVLFTFFDVYYSNLRLREIGITFGLTAVSEINLLLQKRRPSDVVVHPRYKMPSNDIALIKVFK